MACRAREFASFVFTYLGEGFSEMCRIRNFGTSLADFDARSPANNAPTFFPFFFFPRATTRRIKQQSSLV